MFLSMVKKLTIIQLIKHNFIVHINHMNSKTNQFFIDDQFYSNNFILISFHLIFNQIKIHLFEFKKKDRHYLNH